MPAAELSASVAQASLASAVLKGRLASDALRKDAPPAPTPTPAAQPEPGQAPTDPNDGPRVSAAKIVDYRGIQVTVDRPRGTVQKGVGADGKEWVRAYHIDYGHIAGTRGGDEHDPARGKDGQLDVYLGAYAPADEIHWILQKKTDPVTGEDVFDEYKIMAGFVDAESAKAMYLAHTPKKFFGSMASTSVEMMKALLGQRPCETMKILKGLAAAHGAPPLMPTAVETVARTVAVKVAKETTELRWLLGYVLVPGVPDAQGDVYDADEVRKASWGFMARHQNLGLMHKGLINGKALITDNFIAPCAMNVNGSEIPEGAWMLGINVLDDAIWADVKSGKLGGLSIGGFAKRVPVAGS
jgi:hypothetical protein